MVSCAKKGQLGFAHHLCEMTIQYLKDACQALPAKFATKGTTLNDIFMKTLKNCISNFKKIATSIKNFIHHSPVLIPNLAFPLKQK